ncbi:hypothetical protein ACN47E_002348 [Coniothyrium glycines]
MAFKITTLVPTSDVPVDEPFAVNADYLADPLPLKVNLGIGVYRTDEGYPWPLPAVLRAEQSLHSDANLSRHEYLAIQGDSKFLDLARDVAFDFSPDSRSGNLDRARVVSVQTVSGTGANHVGAAYLSAVLRPQRVWLPNPTWGNHLAIWERVGVNICNYPYYDEVNHQFDFAGMMAVLQSEAQPGDVLLLHACAHNPTGSDPEEMQWKLIADLCQSQGLVPFFDLAYQGFASGSVSRDAWAIKHFFGRSGVEFCVAQSFSKNFGLYGQRVGALHVALVKSSIPLRHKAIESLCHLVRSEYSMAPRAGSDIVRRTLESPEIRAQWHADLATMSKRIRVVREALYNELLQLGTPGSWKHIVEQIGMFSYTGLSTKQVLAIRQRYSVYMLQSGRISLSGLTTKNVSYVARAVDDVIRTVGESS